MNLYADSINRLCKWRTVFAGWQLGTRSKEDPECQAVRDLQEARLLLRAEVTALASLFIAKGVFTADEFNRAIAEEAEHLCLDLQKKFPGFTATDTGMTMDVAKCRETMRGWKP